MLILRAILEAGVQNSTLLKLIRSEGDIANEIARSILHHLLDLDPVSLPSSTNSAAPPEFDLLGLDIGTPPPPSVVQSERAANHMPRKLGKGRQVSVAFLMEGLRPATLVRVIYR